MRAVNRSGLGLAALLVMVLACGDRSDRPAAPRPGGESAAAAPRSARPNLVVITLDTTRADALGAYGQPRNITPAIDRMARTGVLFQHAISSSPLTMPSHASIFTGKQPYAHGVRSNFGYVLSDRNVTLAEVLGAAGYRTGAEIAAEVLRRDKQLGQGFDHYRDPTDRGVRLRQLVAESTGKRLGKNIRSGSDISRRGVEFIRANRDRPFFLWLHYFDAHDPYVVLEPFAARAPDSRYHAAVAALDAYVGEVLDTLESLSLAERTLVILTADHGEGLGEHQEPTHSLLVYDTTMRVPLVMWGLESLPKGRTIPSLVRTIDIAPTAVELLGLPPLADAQGVSLAPLIRGERADLGVLGYGESFEVSSVLGLSPLRFVREGSWKYIHKVNPELFDVVADPGERENLAAREPETVARLRARLKSLLRAAPPKPDDSVVSMDASTAAQLAALGYVAATPSAANLDELASFELAGEDPMARIDDLTPIGMILSAIQEGAFDKALELVTPVARRNPDSPYILEMHGDTLAGLGRNAEATAKFARILALSPCDGKALSSIDRLLREQQRYDELIEVLAKGSAECPALLESTNNYAWALATLPRDDLRDGPEAVRLMRAAIERHGEEDIAFLDTLAAGLAESGELEAAVRVQEDVLRKVRHSGMAPELIDELGRHLESYRAGRPLRDPPPAG